MLKIAAILCLLCVAHVLGATLTNGDTVLGDMKAAQEAIQTCKEALPPFTLAIEAAVTEVTVEVKDRTDQLVEEIAQAGLLNDTDKDALLEEISTASTNVQTGGAAVTSHTMDIEALLEKMEVNIGDPVFLAADLSDFQGEMNDLQVSLKDLVANTQTDALTINEHILATVELMPPTVVDGVVAELSAIGALLSVQEVAVTEAGATLQGVGDHTVAAVQKYLSNFQR